MLKNKCTPDYFMRLKRELFQSQNKITKIYPWKCVSRFYYHPKTVILIFSQGYLISLCRFYAAVTKQNKVKHLVDSDNRIYLWSL
jgi:hypothetical protein